MSSARYTCKSRSEFLSPELTILNRFGFSRAAMTRSLSLSYLLTSSSYSCLPFSIKMSTLYAEGSDRSNLTRIIRPISVAMPQFGIVGVNSTRTSFVILEIDICCAETTDSSSSVLGCSGSSMCLIMSKTSHESISSST